MAIAVRIARAASGKDVVAFCGYHGWHDWYLAANLADEGSLDGHLLPGLAPAGVPRSLTGSSLAFPYNDLEALERILEQRKREVGAIVMEPTRSHEPAPGFLQRVREIADQTGAILVFDEVSSGFRAVTGGIHLRYGVYPDIAIFAKAIANGYPMAAIVGKAEVMEHAQRSFISSTMWTERIGPSAALATIKKHRERDVGAHLEHVGGAVQGAWRTAAKRHGLEVTVEGPPVLCHFVFRHGRDSLLLHTLYNQLMLERGFLASKDYYATLAHTAGHIQAYVSAIDEVFAALRRALDGGDAASLLKGPLHHTGFARLA